jgi:hypothetical protein
MAKGADEVQKGGHIFLILRLCGLMLLGARLYAQVTITTPKGGEISPFRNQAVIGQAIPNLPVRLDINGVAVDSGKVRVDGAFEFLGVVTPEGPVTYTVSVLLPGGGILTAERHMHVLGSPDSIVVEMPSTDFPADGSTILRGSASVHDKWEVAIPEGYFVTVDAESLGIAGDDDDPNAPGHQIRLKNGAIAFGLKAGRSACPSMLTLSTNGVSVHVPLTGRTPKMPLMVVASADATGKYLDGQGSTQGLSSPKDFKTGLGGQARLAGIARGTVFDDYLMTLSIDTDRKLEDRIFRDLDPNSLYSMYGDNSIVTYEAQSTSPVYLKMERDQSYLMYGDYTTLVTRNEFSAYNRSFTGGKLHAEEKAYSVDLFGTVTNRKVVQEEMRGQGISGYYYLQQNNVVTGSEKVQIEVRDRFHSEVVITRKEKARYSDYEIDYIQGSLYFKQPIPSLDEQNNPVYIVISYEAISNTADNLVVGGAGELKLIRNLTLGATAVVEGRSPKNYTLFGGNARWQVENMGTLQGEVARSADVAASGNAWKIEAEIAPYRLFSLRPYYRKVDNSFINPTQSGSGRELGTTKYGASLGVEPAAGTRIDGEFYKQQQSQGSLATDIQSLSGSVQQKISDVADVSVKIEDVRYDGENPEAASQNLSSHSTLLNGAIHATVTDALRATAGYEQNLRKAEKQARPNALTLGLEYQMTKAVSVYAQQKFQEEQGQLTTIGINTRVSDQTSVYGRYELGGSIAGERNAATIGLKNSWKVTDELTANILYEKTKNLAKNLVEARTPDHDAVSVGLEYFPLFPLRATLKAEYGKDNANSRTGFDYGVSYKVLDELSILSKGTYFLADSRSQIGSTQQSEYLLGFAYRPAFSNWLNVIGKVQFKSQENTVVQPTASYRAFIASAHVYVEPLERLEFGIKYALKDARDEYDGNVVPTLTDFILVRPQYDLMPKWNVAGEVRFLRQRAAHDLMVGYSLETGYVVMKNAMVAVGYNFQAYKDRDLVDDVFSARGPYVTLRLKLTEDALGIARLD